MTTDVDADRLVRKLDAVERLRHDLWAPDAATRGQAGREHNSRNRNDPPLPIDVRVLDAQHAFNATFLAWHNVALNALGFQPKPPFDPRYKQSPRVAEAIRFLRQTAPSLVRAGLADDLADDLEGLLLEVRRALGQAEHGIPLVDMACPEWIDGQAPCGGELVAFARRGVVLCRACGTRTYDHDWEALGRAARLVTDPAARPKEAA
jgi:hypothetical protein